MTGQEIITGIGGILIALGVRESWSYYYGYKTSKVEAQSKLAYNENEEIKRLNLANDHLKKYISGIRSSNESLYKLMDMVVSAIENDYSDQQGMNTVIVKAKEWIEEARKMDKIIFDESDI